VAARFEVIHAVAPAAFKGVVMSELPPIDFERRARILAWSEADPALQRRFREQLAEHAGWDAARCDQAIREYLRFCIVAVRLGGRAVPSAAVDEVWHLHLTWTRDYWDDFCPRSLGIALHHQPARGLPGEREALRLAYAETLHAYAAEFGMPDAAWWPAWSAPSRERGTHRWAKLAAALGLLPAAAAPAYPGPLEWRGPEFLALYVLLLGACLLWGFSSRLWHRFKPEPSRGLPPGDLPVWHLAYLRGGPQGVIDTATAQLHEDGFLGWDATSKKLVRLSQEAPDDALLRSLLPNLCGDATRLSQAEKSGAVQQLREQLVRQGWWHSEESARRIAWQSALPLWLLAGLGAAKIAIGLLRDRPVALLVFLLIATLVAALMFHFKRPGATRAGRALLRGQRARHALALRAPRSGQLALAVALGGTAVLAGTALAGYHELRHPPSSGESGSSGSDSGSDGGGSGCGGCGGD
jgi:uncharacterized protein (TIGR04222 family)